MIVTKNRKDELRRAIQSALAQTAHVEVLVMDDGSTDGSADMVRAECPATRLERSEISRGYIAQRNRAAKLAEGGIIISIDDDALFPSPHTVEQTLAEFDNPRIGAVAIPYVEPLKSSTVHQLSPDGHDAVVTDNFIGTAHAVRKDLFLRLGGYREQFVHQGEEADYCLRMLAAGYVVRLGSADPIHHLESPNRDMQRMDFYGRRNDILFAWHNVPWPKLPLHLAGTTLNGLATARRAGRWPQMLRGLAFGYADCLRFWSERRPVPRNIYKLHRQLKKRGPCALADIEPRLPPAEALPCSSEHPQAAAS